MNSRRKIVLGVAGGLLLTGQCLLAENRVKYTIDANGSRPRGYRISARSVMFADEIFAPRVLKRSLLSLKGKVYSTLDRSQIGIQNGRWVLVFADGLSSKPDYVVIGDAENLDDIVLYEGVKIEGIYDKDAMGHFVPALPGRVYPFISYIDGFQPQKFSGRLVSTKDLVEKWLSGLRTGDETEENMSVLLSVFTRGWVNVRECGGFCDPGQDYLDGPFDPARRFEAFFAEPVSAALSSFSGKPLEKLRNQLGEIRDAASHELARVEKLKNDKPWLAGEKDVEDMRRIYSMVSRLK